uniref:Uncharacterized protein n=1 Tax=virus sp. ctLl75 TaxID=2828249 RepID=A0A8S5RAD6_9VIRU|nr:MAG TPA: hypothetical protein [virus sp. ctLl75]
MSMTIFLLRRRELSLLLQEVLKKMEPTGRENLRQVVSRHSKEF